MENMSEKYAGGFLPFHPVVLLRDVTKRWLLILLAALIVGVAVYIHADESYAPVYRTTTTYVVTTHIDKGHVHNHIIFCAADNINHDKYHDCKQSFIASVS